MNKVSALVIRRRRVPNAVVSIFEPIFLVFVGLSFVAGCSGEKDLDVAQEDLSCDQPSIDFGKVYRPTSVLSHTFTLKNTSSRNLRLKVAGSSCSCSEVSLDTEDLPPGSESKCRVDWRVPSRPGKESFTVNVVVENEETKGVLLKGFVSVVDTLILDPLEMKFGSVKPGETRSERLTVCAPPGEDIPIEAGPAIGGLPPEISVSVLRRTGWDIVMDVGVTGQGDVGKKTYSFEIQTGDPQQPTIEVPIIAEHLPLYQSIPAAVVLPPAPKDNQVKWVSLISNIGTDLRVDRVDVDNPLLVDTVLRNDPESGLRMGISRKESTHIPAPTSGRIDVYIQDVEKPLSISYLYLPVAPNTDASPR